MKCEKCNKSFEELVTRVNFEKKYNLEWVCEACYNKLEGIDFENYEEEK